MNLSFKKIKDKVLDIVFPDDLRCLLCGGELDGQEVFCSRCLDIDIFNEGTRCMYCDAMIKDDNTVCDFCRDNHHLFEKCFCPLNYNGIVRKTVLRLKEDNAKYLAKGFAKLIYDRLADENLKIDFIVPVPSHISMIKKRGYNPALLIANELSSLMNVPVCEALVKNAKTPNQKFLNYKERFANISSTIQLVDSKTIKDKNILIVDDVITTCATVDACANLMKKAKHIYACAVARTNLF